MDAEISLKSVWRTTIKIVMMFMKPIIATISEIVLNLRLLGHPPATLKHPTKQTSLQPQLRVDKWFRRAILSSDVEHQEIVS